MIDGSIITITTTIVNCIGTIRLYMRLETIKSGPSGIKFPRSKP